MDYVSSICAILGALYIIARTIVLLTPTPRDDAALAKVSVFLKALAKGFGLDLKTGADTNDKPPGNTGIFPSILIMLLIGGMTLPGCIGALADSERGQLLASQKIFVAVVNNLTDLKVAGAFDDQEIQVISLILHEGAQALNAWQSAVLEGRPYSAYQAAFNRIIDQLYQYQLQGGVGVD